MKVFLSTSFSSQVDEATGQVLAGFRADIEAILQALRQDGVTEIFCAAELEGWTLKDEPPEQGVKHDLAEIDAADVLLALVHDKPSQGVQAEIGYAVAKGKSVIIAHRKDLTVPYFNQGLINLGLAHHIVYEDPKALATAVRSLLAS